MRMVTNHYLESVEAAKAELKRIEEYLEDFGEVLPEDVNWGDVGFMSTIAYRLAEITQMIDGNEGNE